MPQRSRISFDVPAAEDGSRLDRAVHARLAEEIDPAPVRADARALVERGAVQVNGRRVTRSSARVRARDRVEVTVDPSALGGAVASRRAQRDLDPAAIVYEDGALIVVDKPAGLPSDATRDPSRDHLLASVTRLIAARDGEAPPFLRLVHRLDAGTSGLVVLGKTREATRALSEAFAGRAVEKIYTAVVDARAVDLPDVWTVEDHLAWSKRDRRMHRVRSGGDPARTDFTVLRRGEARTLVEARPRTGRTHQIRVHLAESGAPIAGDGLYGERAPGSRLLLHATRLELVHPITARPTIAQSLLPPDFARALDAR